MHKKTRNRLILALIVILSVGSGITIILYSVNQNIIFFYPPSKIPLNMHNKVIRVGGLVAKGSIQNISPGKIKFTIQDETASIEVYFQGIPPALFRENQGVVVKGKMKNNNFIAIELLAKHDENYYPPGTEPK